MILDARARVPAARSNTDNAATQITVPGASAFSDMTSGTMLVWVYTTSVANAARVLFGKRGSTGGWQLVKRGVDGTVLRFWAYRATTPMSVDSPSGTLKVNTWQYVALTWDVNTTANCQMVVGGVGTAPQPVAVTVSAGSGAPSSDVALNLDLMAEDSTSGGWPGSMAAFAVIRRVLSVAELQGAAFRDWRRLGCAGLWYPGREGAAGVVVDESGHGNHGVNSGTAQAAPCPGVYRLSPSARRFGVYAMVPPESTLAPTSVVSSSGWTPAGGAATLDEGAAASDAKYDTALDAGSVMTLAMGDPTALDTRYPVRISVRAHHV